MSAVAYWVIELPYAEVRITRWKWLFNSET